MQLISKLFVQSSMRCFFFSVFSLVLGVSAFGSTPNLHIIRAEFHQAALDSDKIESFHRYMASLDIQEPVLMAYRAASEALMAQVTWNPMEKYQLVKKFEALIHEAVSNDPENLEIRFLRFSVEYSIPRFLGVSKNLIEDKRMIVGNLERIGTLNLDPYFTRYILYFLRETQLCEPEYITKIESKLSKS